MERLEGFELVPFRKALDEDADAVMVAHIVVGSLDPDLPASLSGPVITGLLRDKMGFDGVVITDDMTMGAIMENFDIGDAAVQSILAGSDIILVCHGYDKQKAAMDALKKAVGTGTVDEARIDRSVARILRLKDKYEITDNTLENADVNRINEKIEGVLSKWYNVNDRGHQPASRCVRRCPFARYRRLVADRRHHHMRASNQAGNVHTFRQNWIPERTKAYPHSDAK